MTAPLQKHADTLQHARRKRAIQAAGIFLCIVRYFIILGLAFVILYPLLYMVSVSFREPRDLLDPAVVWLPRHVTLENYKMAATFMTYGSTLLRTAALVLPCTLLQCFTSSMTGYGFARFRFKGKNLLYAGALFTLLVPVQTVTMPQFISYSHFSNATGIPALNTPLPMALNALLGMGLRSGLFIYLFTQFYKTMPTEIEEAAYLDGCGPIRAYFQVAVRSAGSILLVSFLLSLVWYWNDYYTVVLYYSASQPMSLILANLSSILATARDASGQPYSVVQTSVFIQSGALLSILPILAIYVILQRRFTNSMISVGIVG